MKKTQSEHKRSSRAVQPHKCCICVLPAPRSLAIAKRLKNDYSQCPDMWKKIQLIVIKIMSLGYTMRPARQHRALPAALVTRLTKGVLSSAG
ncbi:hypothetical protein [Symbiopectobacterium sp. RP]|uniref:hypothetical protein n=1 Tax=Symbiopectobacterium sp. RP TaxID=3248553 RepID=UPI003D29B049